MSDQLADKKCIPCSGLIPALTSSEAHHFLHSLSSEWKLNAEATKIHRHFKFSNFKKALEFTNKVGAIAEAEFHHPDLELGWGYVKITIFTHKIQALVESDFILAAKIDQIPA
jgi:4a-hydroxytetrahydrobiopterin dehydratase